MTVPGGRELNQGVLGNLRSNRKKVQLRASSVASWALPVGDASIVNFHWTAMSTKRFQFNLTGSKQNMTHPFPVDLSDDGNDEQCKAAITWRPLYLRHTPDTVNSTGTVCNPAEPKDLKSSTQLS
jgi:hypothetical protein